MMQTLFQQVSQKSWFTKLVQKIQVLQSLQLLFDQTCPSELIGKCYVADLKHTCLTVLVDNASHATYLRYRKRELIPLLKQHPEFINLETIQVYIKQPI